MAEKKNTASSGKKPGTDKKSGTKTPTVKNTTYNSSPIPAQIILGFICLGCSWWVSSSGRAPSF